MNTNVDFLLLVVRNFKQSEKFKPSSNDFNRSGVTGRLIPHIYIYIYYVKMKELPAKVVCYAQAVSGCLKFESAMHVFQPWFYCSCHCRRKQGGAVNAPFF